MLQVTPNAAKTVDAAMRQQHIPQEYGMRLSAAPSPDGQLSVSIAFAPAPAENDVVDEQHGLTLFVAEEVVEPLAEAALDVTHDVTTNGDEPPELILRPQG